MSDIAFVPVKRSDTLDSVAFYPEYKDLVVKFKTGGIYVYRGADESLAKHLTTTVHPWSKFRTVVQALPYERLSKGLRAEPLKRKRAAKPAASTEPKIVVAAGAAAEKKQASARRTTIKATVPATEQPKRSPGRPRKDGTPAQPRVKVGEKMVRAEEAPVEEPKTKVTRTRKPATKKPDATRGIAFSDAK